LSRSEKGFLGQKKPSKLLTPKQEKFCHAIIQGHNQSEACRLAYGVKKATAKTINERASRLMANSKVVARVAELQAPAVKKAQRSYEQWLRQVEEVAFVPLEQLDVKTPDKLKALELFGKATGYYHEKLDTPASALENASTELLVAMLAELEERKRQRGTKVIEG